MNTIEVRLFSNLRQYRAAPENDGAILVQMADEAKLADLYDRLKIPRKEVAIAMVNGRSAPEGYVLRNGDRVGLFPLIAGG